LETTTAVRAAARVSNAFVATVVPIRTCEPEQGADSGDGGVVVPVRVVRQQLVRCQLASRRMATMSVKVPPR